MPDARAEFADVGGAHSSGKRPTSFLSVGEINERKDCGISCLRELPRTNHRGRRGSDLRKILIPQCKFAKWAFLKGLALK